MPKGRPKKLPGEDLDPTLKTTLDNMNDTDLRAKVSEVALYRQARQNAMKNDPAVQQAREGLTNATQDYKDEIKGSDRTIKYATYLLESRGKL
jgi:hypothetical protein